REDDVEQGDDDREITRMLVPLDPFGLAAEDQLAHDELGDDQDGREDAQDHQEGFHRQDGPREVGSGIPGGVPKTHARSDAGGSPIGRAGSSRRASWTWSRPPRVGFSLPRGPEPTTLNIMEWERIRLNLESVRSRMDEAARRSGRDPAAVTLVAVTKRSR